MCSPKFARTARRVGRTTPVLTVAVGRSATGKLLAGARAAKVATPLATRQALFQQAGIIAVANLGELLDTAALLAAQPVPAGNRVGVVSNTRGAVVLAADACAGAGLQVAGLVAGTQQELRDLLGRQAMVSGPVDTTLLVTPGSFGRCLEVVGADPGVDLARHPKVHRGWNLEKRHRARMWGLPRRLVAARGCCGRAGTSRAG